MSYIRVKLKRSRINCTPIQRKVLDALGLRRREMVKIFTDSASIQGMIIKVSHLVEVSRL